MVFCSFVRLSKPPSRQQILAMQDAGTSASQRKEEPAVQKTILTALAATLIAASTAQIASASEHRRAHKRTSPRPQGDPCTGGRAIPQRQ
jgi:hypothetical protein